MKVPKKLLEVEGLKIYYRVGKKYVKAVDGVSFFIRERETLGLVGESGCGKSTLGFGIMKLLPPGALMKGRMIFQGKNLLELDDEEFRKLRGSKVSMIFQDPMTSLNPIMKIKDHFEETIRTHLPNTSDDEVQGMISRSLENVGIDPTRMNEYPFQFSGGMRQRVMIALSLVLNPSLVIADEPTTSLDVIVQAQILDLLKDLKRKFSMSMILITHDLGVVAEMADRIAVMYAGHIVELSERDSIYYSPKHPYTRALLESIPNTDIDDRELKYIPGSPPDLSNPPKGCRFAPRCTHAMKICHEKEPPVFKVNGSLVKCWLFEGADEVGFG